MRQIIKNVICLGLGVLALTGCKLDTQPKDKFPESAVWGNYATARGFLNDSYTIMGWMIQNDDWSDNTVINSSQTGSAAVLMETINADSNFGWNMYFDVRKCNKIIEQAEASDFLPQEKDFLIGSAKFLRATTYFAAARKFGRLMIVDTVLDPESEFELPRTKTIKETYDFILNDLDEAIRLLPVQVETGVPGKGAALALKAEVCLQGAAYLTSPSEKADYYAQGEKASQDLIDLGAYQLDTDFYGMMNTYEGALNSPEMILARYHVEKNTQIYMTWMQELVANMGGDKGKGDVLERWPLDKPLEGWLERTPSQELADTYLVIDQSDGVAKHWSETSQYQSFTPNAGEGVHSVLYDNRDKRFYTTIVCDSSKYFTNLVTTRLGGNVHYLSNAQQDRHMTKSGYLYRKGVYEDKWLSWEVPTNYCYPVFRYGRSLLNYAELILRHQGAAGVAQAVRLINQTRAAHGELPALSESISLADAWKYYKIERRAELVQENDRYWSLLRWGKEDGLDVIPELNTPPTAIEISFDGQSFKILDEVPVVGPVNRRHFTKRRYLLPIPRSEVSENPQLKNDQNPGWE